MTKTVSELRPIYVVGIGLHKYQPLSEVTYISLGLTAIREALVDARLEWESVESTYVATARLGIACGRGMLKHLGGRGKPLVHIENASASGSAAFRHACIEVAAGISDVVLAVGVDKPVERSRLGQFSGGTHLVGGAIVPFTHFALLANEYMESRNLAAEDVALVSVKNHRNGALNPYAQRQTAFKLEDVLATSPVAGILTALQCTP